LHVTSGRKVYVMDIEGAGRSEKGRGRGKSGDSFRSDKQRDHPSTRPVKRHRPPEEPSSGPRCGAHDGGPGKWEPCPDEPAYFVKSDVQDDGQAEARVFLCELHRDVVTGALPVPKKEKVVYQRQA
jgi:hypothetical protein